MATATTTSFELTGADGEPLRGEVRTASRGLDRPAVVICHGFKGFKDWGFFPYLAQRVARAGMTAVTFNFSGSGVGADGQTFSEPERFRRATISNHLRDLESVSSALLAGAVPGTAVPTALGVVGHSLGGGVAALFAAQHPECRALVTWAAVASFLRWDDAAVRAWRASGALPIVNARTGEVLPLGLEYLEDLEREPQGRLDPLRAASAIGVPWLIVHGDEDETVDPAEAVAYFGAASGGTARLEMVPGTGHTFEARHPWNGATPAVHRVVDGTVAWFSRYLL